MEFLTIIVLMESLLVHLVLNGYFSCIFYIKNIISNEKKAFKPVLQLMGVLFTDAIQSLQKKKTRGKIIEYIKSLVAILK